MRTTVLIVDDHPGFRSCLRTLLEADGFAVVAEAGDGAEGLRMARRHAPEVVIVDVGLPDISGFDVARALAGERAGPCVVLVSSRDAVDYGGLVAESGACGFMPKSEITGDAIERMMSRR
ncbi:MAG: response regulator transcription factor [Actinomycetota bacterium]